jgi:proteasome accessory factor C
LVPRPAADERLERVLLLIPLAAREDGISLDELADRLGVTPAQVLADIDEIIAREYYHPAESPIDLQVLIERERVTLWTSGEFLRPPKLSPAEGLALALGLRLLAEGADGERRERILDLARRLDEQLGAAPAPVEGYALEAGDPEGGGVLDLLRQAADARRRCRLEYLKPAGEAPETRIVHPYSLVFSGGAWYVLAWSEEKKGVRAFRLDRILEAEALEDEFEPGYEFRPEDHLEDGVVFRAGETIEALVRYSPRVAQWLRERGEGELQPDGSVLCRRRVADPSWLVRHALWYGPEAEVLAPPAMRDAVRAAIETIRKGDDGSR